MKFVDTTIDPWRLADGEDGPLVMVSPEPGLVLTLAQWESVRAAWPANTPVGLLLANDADVEALEPDLPRLALVVLQFPKWTDGRAYSQGRLLRGRYRFAGELRATGDVLVDMLPLLQRTGFDAVVLRADQKVSSARRALGFFAGHYQGDTTHTQPHFSKVPA